MSKTTTKIQPKPIDSGKIPTPPALETIFDLLKRGVASRPGSTVTCDNYAELKATRAHEITVERLRSKATSYSRHLIVR